MSKFIKIFILTFVLFLCCSIPVFASNTIDTTAIDNAGYRLLKVLQAIGFWVVVLKGIYDVIKCAISNDRQKLGQTIISYIIIASAMYGVPAIVNMIKTFFE